MSLTSVILILLILIIFIGGIITIRQAIKTRQKNLELIQSVTSIDRGTKSELELILQLVKKEIPPSIIFHDLYVETYKDHYSQIDAVVPTKVGIIVFEVKDYSGWIFGKGYQKSWTQVLAYGKEKNHFYNPVAQNNGHITALKEKLKNDANVPYFSVIIFYGGCVLRDVTINEENTFVIYPYELSNIINHILVSNPPANYSNKRNVVDILREAVNNGANPEIRQLHINNIQQKRKICY